ncbi:hypothetical protein ACFW81_02555 [Streptomyces angustmyceticus]|uniref:hypothetical protein n=1 Tax=Streptomyces angustmyceticus TaxID=285578 RepID=UPI0036C5CCB0
MPEIRFRIEDVGDSHVTPGKVAVRVAEAVRGWVWLVVPAGVSETLAKALIDVPGIHPDATDEAPGTGTVRALADLVLRTEWINWRDLSGTRREAMNKASRNRLEAKLTAYRASLEVVMQAEGVDGHVDDFLEELSEWKVRHGSTWRYTRSLHGYRKSE